VGWDLAPRIRRIVIAETGASRSAKTVHGDGLAMLVAPYGYTQFCALPSVESAADDGPPLRCRQLVVDDSGERRASSSGVGLAAYVRKDGSLNSSCRPCAHWVE
jgi:hypothetical protein